MRLFLLFVSALLMPITSMAQTYVDVNETNFPDENFRNIILAHPSYDSGTGKIRTDEIKYTSSSASSTNLGNLNNKNITDLTGIEHFKNLESLSCDGNTLTSLNLTQNTKLETLSCDRNYSLTTLNIAGLNLTTLLCNQCALTTLDVSECTNLKSFQCSFNQLSDLDLSKNTYLQTLLCQNNKLETLDLSSNIRLKTIRCFYQDPKMTALTIPNTSTLNELQCHGNELTAEVINANIKQGEVKLEVLACGENPLGPTIDLSTQTKLKTLSCNDANLSSLTVYSPVLQLLDCHDGEEQNSKLYTLPNNLTKTSLDISRVSNESLTSLTISGNTGIEDLTVDNINTSRFTNLKYFYCGNCGLTEADITNNKMLQYFECYNNSLTTLDVSNNTNLTRLLCNDNKLTKFDVSANSNLTILNVSNNRLRFINLTNNNINTNNFRGNGQLFYDNLVVLGENRDKLGIYISDEDEGILTTERFYTGLSKSETWRNSGYASVSEIVTLDEKQYLVLYTNQTADMNVSGSLGYYFDHKSPKGTTTYEPNTLRTTGYISPYVMYVNPLSQDLQDNFYSGTLFVDYDAVVPEGAEAYIVTGVKTSPTTITKNGTDVTFDQLSMVKVGSTGDVIPANTPIYVKAATDAGLYAFNKAGIANSWNDAEYTCVTIPDGNLLQGITTDTPFGKNAILTLGREQNIGTGQVGFWYYNGGTLKAHRCYLQTSILSTTNNAKGAIFNFDGNTTGITSIDNENTPIENNIWYTLNGIRLNAKPTQKGIYLHNGKKEVIR